MKCKHCGKIEGFDGEFQVLICQQCLDAMVNRPLAGRDKVYEKLEEYLSLRSNAAEREVRIIEEIIKRLSRLNELDRAQIQSNDHNEEDVKAPTERGRSSSIQSLTQEEK